MPVCNHDPNIAWTVSELNTFVRETLREGLANPIWVQGALTRFSFSRGCVYTSIKDERGAQLKLVFFGGQNVFERMRLQIGDVVMVCGTVDLYVQGGDYQFNVRQIVPLNSTGALMQQFLDIRERLQREGLFDESRRKPLPLVPSCVAVITSLDVGKAAVHDFLNTIYSRVPNLRVRLIGTKVQGEGTAENIMRILQYLNATQCCDVIVITRGGGSMEDLWEFNNEMLARTIAASKIPVVTAIGHQIDNTICDFVADYCAITPTDAANAVTNGLVQINERLAVIGERMANCLTLKANALRIRFNRAAQCVYLTRPLMLYSEQRQRLDMIVMQLNSLLPQRAAAVRARLDMLTARLKPAISALLMQRKGECERATRVLATLDPKGVLQRGYAILLDDDGHAVRKAADVQNGQHLTALLASDKIRVTVTE